MSFDHVLKRSNFSDPIESPYLDLFPLWPDSGSPGIAKAGVLLDKIFVRPSHTAMSGLRLIPEINLSKTDVASHAG
jgi:hypothetical protein